MNVISFDIRFLSPFRVGASTGRDGIDAPVDHHRPLPADHLKGMMRSAATDILGLNSQILAGVFGSPAAPSPWAWTDAVPGNDADWTPRYRHRVKIDEATHTASRGSLVLAESLWTDTATFQVRWAGPAAGPAVDEVLVLAASGAATHAIGAWRRRGLGWVSITANDVAWDTTATERLLNLREPVTAKDAAPVAVEPS